MDRRLKARDYAPNQIDYHAWRAQRRSHFADLQARQRTVWNKLISVAVVVGADTSDPALQATLQSLLDQSWHNLEVTIFAGNRQVAVDGEAFAALRGLAVVEGQEIDALFRFGPTALGLRGDYLAVVPAGTVFDSTAFYALNHAVVQTTHRPEPHLVLFDHEFAGVLPAGEPVMLPAFLPGFDPDLLRAEDYIGCGALVQAALADRLAGRAETLRGLLLAASEAEPALTVGRICDVLMRVPGQPPGRRSGPDPADAPPLAEPAHIGPEGIAVVIPNRDKPELLAQCVRSLAAEPEVRELIIVDNASTEPETLALYDRLKRESGAKVVAMNHPFNFSRMINVGVAASTAETVLLLNNDIEFRRPGVLGPALAAAMRPDVGIVGSVLLYPDATLQHAGMLLDYAAQEAGLLAMHVGRGADAGSPGYLGQYRQPRNCQAVTGAFMLLRRAVFDAAGGFDEVALPVEYNDIDFCLRVRATGHKVLCLPLPEVFHHESASRGKVDTPAVLAMRSAAQRLMLRRWLHEFRTDPYNHPIARLGERAEVEFNFARKFVG